MAQIVSIHSSPDYEREIRRTAELLLAGKLAVLPTETVYAVAGVISQPDARAALHGLRPSKQAFTIHVARPDDARQYISAPSRMVTKMMRKLWPGPVGLVLDVPADRMAEVAKSLDVPSDELYTDGTITLRCPEQRVFTDVAAIVDKPIAMIARGEAHRASDLPDDLSAKAEIILDAGETRYSKPSTLLRVHGEEYEILRSGIYDQRIIDRLMKTTILFICSGNTCRSPMAEAIARKMISEKLGVGADDLDRKQIAVTSAGSFALPGAKATAEGVQVLKDMGIDLTRHRSRPLSVELINQADVIYAMSKGHARDVMAMVPSARDKVATLDPENDVEDPIGGDLSLYTDTAKQLKMLIERRLGEIEL